MFVWPCVHDGGTTPQPHKPEGQHQAGGLCPAQGASSYTAKYGESLGLEERPSIELSKINYHARQSSM